MKTKTFLFTAALLAGAATAFGNSAEITAHSINSGGGQSKAGPTVLTGTIGASIAGFSTGGNVALTGGFSATLEIILPEPGESFETWMASLPAPHQPPPGQRGPYDEPAGDGMSNLLKYALGLMPMTPSADAAPRIVRVPFQNDVDGPWQHKLALEFKASVDAAVTFEIEAETDLTQWQNVTFSRQNGNTDGDGRQEVSLITNIVAEDHDRHFLRLIVTADP